MGAGLGGVVVAPSSLLCFGSWRALAFHWTVGGCALSGGLDSSGLVPFSLGSLGGHPGTGAVGEPAWDTVPLGTPLLMPVGGFWCSWCFSPLSPF